MNTKYTLKIYPKGLGREVYRVLEIDGKESLDTLCSLILATFDFDWDHLYEFCMSGKIYDRFGTRYVCTDDIDGDGPTSITLDEIGLYKGQNFLFHYDFGDDWQFMIHVNKIEKCDEPTKWKYIKRVGDVMQYPSYDDEEEEWDE